MYAKDLSKPKNEFLIKKRDDTGIKHFNDPNAFTEYSNTRFYERSNHNSNFI